MRVIIAGSRNITDCGVVENAIRISGFEIKEVVCGGAKGVDQCGAWFAKDAMIPVKMFPANWSKYGKKAGILRNKEMVRYADALIAVWDGKSPGTKHIISEAELWGLKVLIYIYSPMRGK